ncbi:MAG TPA: hypothetical protein VK738_14960 [Terriglobales bacterium]|nr:hypothetical protein [Terriglobales bacterium]
MTGTEAQELTPLIHIFDVLEVTLMRLSLLGSMLATVFFCVTAYAQQQMASLRPGHGLMWQRTSPTVPQPDGPVLYQLIFNASGVPGTVPAFDTNPRHLTNSPITVSGGNVLIGGGNGTMINGTTGIISFANGQTFPGAGGASSVGLSAPASDFNVTGSPVTTSGTLTLNWKVAPTNANIANAIVKRDASGNFSANGITTNFLSSQFSSPAFTLWSASNLATTGVSNGISGRTLSAVYPSAGVYGSGPGYGILGDTSSTVTSPGSGVIGRATASTGTAQGVQGFSQSPVGIGVYGADVSASNSGAAYAGVLGAGVWGDSGAGPGRLAVFGTADGGQAGAFLNNSSDNETLGVENLGSGPVFAAAGSSGRCTIDGSGGFQCSGAISGSAKNFRIDHPLDPANKYLVHASVESSEMMNIYTGNVTTDAQGQAIVELPNWFEALNGDFRYQLTVIGQFAQAIVAHKIHNHQFTIRTSVPNVEVSWQVTGVRQDEWAKAHPLVVEEVKKEKLQGHYIHPELYGAPKEQGIEWERHPELMKRGQDRQAQNGASQDQR